jgi:hypothetical protein
MNYAGALFDTRKCRLRAGVAGEGKPLKTDE